MATTFERTREAIESTHGQPSGEIERRGRRRVLWALVIVVVVALSGVGAWAIYDQARDSDSPAGSAPETEVEEVVADYFATLNAYDRDGFAELTTDAYMAFATDELSPSAGATQEQTREEYLGDLEAWMPLSEVEYERLGEPLRIGSPDGAWHVAESWQMRSTTPDDVTIVDAGISIITVVDDDGTLRVARDVNTPYRVHSTDAGAELVSELDGEIARLIDSYFATQNAYDSDGFAELITDEYTMFRTFIGSYVAFASLPPDEETSAAEYLVNIEGQDQFHKVQYERIGEPFMMGNAGGPWHVAQAWHKSLTRLSGVDIVDGAISILTVVDDDGTLRVARDINTQHRLSMK
ncbi:MAG: hypothetical protein KJN63_04690 [Acidimicrobiia bacterium]|nr:hypothetical protein [Acidimicrobiia bacterium]